MNNLTNNLVSKFCNDVYLGDFEAVKQNLHLIKESENQNGRVSALMMACRCKHVDLVNLLINNGADIYAESLEGSTCLSEICNYVTSAFDTEQAKKILEIFLNLGMDINHKNKKKETMLFRAVWTKNIELVRFLISKGANVDLQSDTGYIYFSNTGYTPLIISAIINDFEILKLLLENGADAKNVTTPEKRDALMYACEHGNLESVKLLLKHVDKNYVNSMRDLDEKNILYHACKGGNREVIIELIKFGCDTSCYCFRTLLPVNTISDDLRKDKELVDMLNYESKRKIEEYRKTIIQK